MATKSEKRTEDSTVLAPRRAARSLDVARRGIRTSQDFATAMSELMCDLLEGRVTPGVGNATVNAGGKLLKVVEMQYRYGIGGPKNGQRTLMLAAGARKNRTREEA